MSNPGDAMIWTWGGWEPLQFYRRLGGFHEAQEGNALWAEQWFQTLHSERTAAALAEAGINWVTTHFFKGFGLAAEAEEIDRTERMIRNCHAHGVKVFAYLQYGTIVPESIVTEVPESIRWRRVDWADRHDGHPYEYGDQYWRSKPCANQPGFREYLLRCVERAVEIGADGIWVDNLNADGCHCEACQTAFRDFLRRSVQDPWRDLGIRNVSLVGIPRACRPREPLYQQWVRFRCQETADSIRLLAAKARAIKSGILVAANIGLGNNVVYTADNGNWVGNLGVVDYCYAENSLFPRFHDGRIVSQHLPMKLAEAVGFRIVPGAGFGGGGRLYPAPAVPHLKALRRVFAESAMLGRHAAGGPWGLRGENAGRDPVLLRDAEYRANSRRLAEAYASIAGWLADAADAAPVALLYSFEAMSFDQPAANQAFRAFEELLRGSQVPFRYVLSDRPVPEGLELLILPHVLPMSDALAAAIRDLVRRGGKVLATGRTSLYDEWFRQRTDYAVADVLGASFSNEFETDNWDRLVTHAANGCMLLPGEWGLSTPGGRPACALSGRKILQAVRRAVSPAALPEVCPRSPQIGLEVRKRPDGSRVLALLNYDDRPVKNIEIRLTLPGKPPEAVTAFDLDRGEHRLRCRRLVGGRVAVRLSRLQVECYVRLDAPR